jgi:uncharacterized protein with FMN-binding domain
LPGSKNVKNRALAWLHIFILPALFAACGAALDDSDTYAPGVYTGSAVSYGGVLSVTTTFSANAIVEVEVIECHDTTSRPAVQEALDAIPQAIIAANSFTVDVISGATITSRRIMDAAEACGEQARLAPHKAGNPNEWRFINNSGYTFNVNMEGEIFELKPGGNHVVLASSEEPSFTTFGPFNNVAQQRSPGAIIFVNR